MARCAKTKFLLHRLIQIPDYQRRAHQPNVIIAGMAVNGERNLPPLVLAEERDREIQPAFGKPVRSGVEGVLTITLPPPAQKSW